MSYRNYCDNNEWEFENDFEKDFYNAMEWEKRNRIIIPSMLGSEISHSFDPKFQRLARIHRITSYAEHGGNKSYAKYAIIKEQFSFLMEYMPDDLFDKICQIMGYMKSKKKRYAKDIKINVETLMVALALWQLELYTKNDYIKETVLQEINDYLLSHSSYGKIRQKGLITMKDIQRAEGNILKDIFDIEMSKKGIYYFEDLPPEALSYYRYMISSIEDFIPEDYKPIKKLREKDTEITYNGYIFTWVVRKELMKKLLGNIAIQYKFPNLDTQSERIIYLIERLFLQREVTLGDIPSLCIVFLDYITQNLITLKNNMPPKFYSRIEKYRKRILPILASFEELEDFKDCNEQIIDDKDKITASKEGIHQESSHSANYDGDIQTFEIIPPPEPLSDDPNILGSDYKINTDIPQTVFSFRKPVHITSRTFLLTEKERHFLYNLFGKNKPLSKDPGGGTNSFNQ